MDALAGRRSYFAPYAEVDPSRVTTHGRAVPWENPPNMPPIGAIGYAENAGMDRTKHYALANQAEKIGIAGTGENQIRYDVASDFLFIRPVRSPFRVTTVMPGSPQPIDFDR